MFQARSVPRCLRGGFGSCFCRDSLWGSAPSPAAPCPEQDGEAAREQHPPVRRSPSACIPPAGATASRLRHLGRRKASAYKGAFVPAGGEQGLFCPRPPSRASGAARFHASSAPGAARADGGMQTQPAGGCGEP